jgi:hypothetical protein
VAFESGSYQSGADSLAPLLFILARGEQSPRQHSIERFFGCRRMLRILPHSCHDCGMTQTVRIDGSNRIVLSKDVRRAAGLVPRQKLKVVATPGRIVLEVQPNSGKIVKRGKLKVWVGKVPLIPLEEAIDHVRCHRW